MTNAVRHACFDGRDGEIKMPLRGIEWVILIRFSRFWLPRYPFVRSAPSFRPDLRG
jgi:hypothetical protein